MSPRRAETGASLLGLLAFFGVVLAALWLAFKVVPAYYLYFSAQRMLDKMVVEMPDAGDGELRTSFTRRLEVSFVEDLAGADLKIERGAGRLVLSVPVRRCRPLAHGISVCVELEAHAEAARP